MKKTFVSLTILTTVICLAISQLSCNKKFDAPPYNVAPNISANISIAALKSLHTVPGTVTSITDTSIISGTIVANDKSGNIYKELFIQDTSGGIELMLGGTNLYSSYPVGMRLFVKCQGLVLSDYNGNMELGYLSNTGGSSAITSVPSALFSQYLVAGTLNNPVVPTVVTMAQLTSAATTSSTNPSLDKLQNTLIQIEDAQFADTTGLVYSDTSAAKANVSRTVTSCSGGSTIIYTSGYADFAGVKLPKGNGPIASIYTPYKGTSELIVRDTSDIQFTGARCNGATSPLTSLSTIRALYQGSTISAIGAYTIHGTVISDAAHGNISKGNVVIQDGNSGISLYFGSTTITYNVGDSIVLDVTGAQLQSYMGSLELDPKSGTTPPTPVATGRTVTPNVITVAQLTSNISTIENTLVEIVNATTPTGTYSGSKTLTDASGSMTMYTLSGATFATTALPVSASNFIGYATPFSSTTELHIRNTTDVTAGTGGGGGGNTIKSIAQIRALYSGSTVTLPAYTIHGTVISDAAHGNISKGNVVIQDGNSGISLYFGSVTITYNVGDSIVLDVTGAKLQAFNGALEIDPVSSTLPTPVATGVTVTPQVLTIAQVTANISTVEYTLVTIDNATASGGSTYSGSKTLTDASGNFVLYTATAATFSGTALPTGAHNWTGYPHNYNTTSSSSIEFNLRNTTDVQ